METGIDYGGKAWNVVVGCSKKSDGCMNCWALRMAIRMKGMGRPEYQVAVDDDGRWSGQTVFLPHKLKEPLKWRKPQNILVSFMGDLFHHTTRPLHVYQIFDVMESTPRHTYYVLTKRPDRMAEILTLRDALPNVLLGVSVENQKAADARLKPMNYLHRNGWRTWASYEPALEAVGWYGWEFLDWMVCGGESGAKARGMPPSAARNARDFCSANNIPFYFKQWGAHAPLSHLPWITDKTTFKYRPIDVAGEVMVRVGKGLAGHVLDGQEWREMPK